MDGKCKAKKSWPEKWGTVDVKQYYHEFSLDETVPEEAKKRPCRDSRYKFDRPSRDVWNAAANDPSSAGFKLIKFFKACQITDSALLSEGEFKQLAELDKDDATQTRCEDLAAKAEQFSRLSQKL